MFLKDNEWEVYFKKLPLPKWFWKSWEPSSDYCINEPKYNIFTFITHIILLIVITFILGLAMPILGYILFYGLIPMFVLYMLVCKLPRTLIILKRKVSLLFKHVDKTEPNDNELKDD